MEQAVWIAFGVIAVVIGFAIVVNLVNTNTEDKKLIAFEDALIRLGKQCEFVCDSSPDTQLPVRVTLPSGLYLYANGQRICGIYDGQTKCEICPCTVTMPRPLELNTSLAKFTTHSYECRFLRLEIGTQMECKG